MKVEQLDFDFDATVVPFQYEHGGVVVHGWPPTKVVDVVAHEAAVPPPVTWLVEAKDFRVITNPPARANLQDLAPTMDAKVRASIAGLAVAAAASNDPTVRAHAGVAIQTGSFRVVLHVEPHVGPHTRLFPIEYLPDLLVALRRLVKDIDADALVLDIARTGTAPVPWTVS